MDKELLKQFFQQEHVRIEVYKFMKQTLDEIALERIYKGEEVGGIKDAKEVLVRAETKLQNMFAVRKVHKDERRAE
jgi:formylmethanofuran dehydrogenase subunit C